MTTIILDIGEAAQLEQLEATIKTGLSGFIEVGEALSAIRDGKLYRATHGTFEDYCREKWNMSASRARQLCGASEVGKSVTNVTLTTESQARELARVEPANRQAVVEHAASGGKLTAASIKEAAQVIEMTPAPVKPARCSSAMPASGMFIARGAIEMMKQIQPDDPQRREAMNTVRIWCFNQAPPVGGPLADIEEDRREATTLASIRVSMSDAKQLWLIAKGRLDNIRKADQHRDGVLREVAAYAADRIARKV